MPRFDGTGPQGAGPATGRGMGPCGQGRGYGQGRGFGRGRGMGGRFCGFCGYPQAGRMSSADEKSLLKEDVQDLEAELSAAKERLAELDKAPNK